MITRRVVRAAGFIVLVSYTIVLVTLTHMPKPPGVFEGQNDKTLHFLAYFCFGSFLFTVIALTWPRVKVTALITFLVGAGFAALDEYTQPYFGRSSDILDWRADLTGLVGAVIVMTLVRWLIERRVPLMTPKPSDSK